MKKIVGIVVEYNPFHNGHKLHCLRAKEYGDVVIAVMSGDYLQRGEPAILNRWRRAELALKNGVDIVVELPSFYSTQSAEIFAIGAVGILNQMGTDKLVFGSETSNIQNLRERANLEEKPEFKEKLKKELKLGSSYPTAYSKVLADLGQVNKLESNDILGIEYIKAIKFWNSFIEAISIKREKSEYYSEKTDCGITSATGIRKRLEQNEAIDDVVPESTYRALKDIGKNIGIPKLEDFYCLIRYKILQGKNELKYIQDVENGYENRLYEEALNCNEFKIFLKNISSKRYTNGRIQRILIHILLGITKEQTIAVKNKIPYIRVLGFTKSGQNYLKAMKKNDVDIEILTSLRNIQTKLSRDELDILEKNEIASKIYSMLYGGTEQKIPLIIEEN